MPKPPQSPPRRRTTKVLLVATSLSGVVGCSTDTEALDSGARPIDAGLPVDVGGFDLGIPDFGLTPVDAGVLVDAGVNADLGPLDAGVEQDGGSDDVGLSD